MINARGILDQVISHATKLGIFENVTTHEPKNAPNNGLHCAVWMESIEAIDTSSLISTSGKLVFSIRVYASMLQEPQDDIDNQLMDAVDTLLNEYSGQFTLGLNAQSSSQPWLRMIDLLGAYGTSLSMVMGYLSQDGKLFRVATITLPMIVNDIWGQAAGS